MADVCCLRMSARCSPRSIRSTAKDITRLSNAGSNHDCGSLSRVVMVRKTDQRVINHKSQRDPSTEVITLETIQTYRGHKPDRTVVIKKRDSSVNSPVLSSTMSERDHGYSSLTQTSQTKSEMSKEFSSMSLLTSDDLTSTHNSPSNDYPRKSISRDTNNNGPGTMFAKPNRNVINSKLQLEDRLAKTPTSARNSPNLRYSTPSPVSRRSIFSEFELDCLRAHNEYRRKHGVAPLKLSKKMCRHAEEWAKILASRGIPTHRNNSCYGENIFCSWSSNGNDNNISGSDPVDHWYAEMTQHAFHKEPTTLKTGHFTQVVWRESRDLGVGVSRNRSGEVFVVANYDPPGNFIGSFEKNVLPILDGNEESKFSLKPETEETDKLHSEEELEAFAGKLLKFHNEFRRKHHAPELKLTKELMNDAQHWAVKLAKEDKLIYRYNSEYGENLYCLWSSDRDEMPNPKDVCKSWYDEKVLFNWNAEPRGAFKAAQFSQMVWTASKELGVGLAHTNTGKIIVVATYYPRGNVVGQFLQNVKRAN